MAVARPGRAMSGSMEGLREVRPGRLIVADSAQRHAHAEQLDSAQTTPARASLDESHMRAGDTGRAAAEKETVAKLLACTHRELHSLTPLDASCINNNSCGPSTQLSEDVNCAQPPQQPEPIPGCWRFPAGNRHAAQLVAGGAARSDGVATGAVEMHATPFAGSSLQVTHNGLARPSEGVEADLRGMDTGAPGLMPVGQGGITMEDDALLTLHALLCRMLGRAGQFKPPK
jgi:hypothetical protein